MKFVFLLCFFTLLALSHTATRSLLDFDWRFNLGDIKGPNVTQLNYDDSKWRQLNIPHDFVVEGNFTRSADESHGFLPYGIGWYRKHFTIPSDTKGKTIWVDFDGTYRNTDVYLNGFFLGNHPSGYTSYRFYISNVSTLNYGSENVLAIRTDCTQPEGWWYDGGGIYRHVWLNVADPVHIRPWGVYAAASVTGTIVTDEIGQSLATSSVTITTDIDNWNSAAVSGYTLSSEIKDQSGKSIAQVSSDVSVSAKGNVTIKQTLNIAQANLWSLESPYLYTLTSSITKSGTAIDSVDTTFGVRKIFFDVNNGFYLNDQPVKIKGFANHQDFAGLGTAVSDNLQFYRVSRLKEMGANAWRTAHNPPNPALLDAADRLGFLVWDENHYLLSDIENQADVRRLVLRDRNHPSIILWSLCNEVLCEGEGTEKAEQVGQLLKSIIHEYDTTRPVTAAMNGGWGSGLSYVVDVQGFNYNIGQYDPYHRSHPKQPLIGSETASCVSDRGIYANDPTRAYVSAYDVNRPSWGNTAEEAWQGIDSRDFMSGCFIWTGFDYKGEPTPYGWPNINSHFGTLDIAGFAKDNFYYYQAWWIDQPSLHVFPHWNWNVGQTVDVWAYSNADSVELFVNGVSQGKQKMPFNAHVHWEVKYSPGSIEGRSYDKNGKQILSKVIETTGAPQALNAVVDFGSSINANGQDVALVAVSVVDSKGRVVQTASNEVTFSVSGPGFIAGTGNGDPSSHDRDKSPVRDAFNGYVRAIVQATTEAGTITVTATAPGLQSAKVTITSK
eukprot:TRINITY_DN323_c0_g1_i1.p1 TRINITY_DN323_c0_g1~~TRINITY_DN323_c0_g1_i1.p1  ORF type:complete len:779 (-),score=173.01 TRINITY_DN323_c0_g1_i1:14-2350(-)